MKKLFMLLALMLIVFAINGCATIISGSTQNIEVNSTPSGAVVTADPGGLKVTTPGKLILKREKGPYKVTFTLDGYEPYSVMLTTGSNGWVWGNLLLGGIVGLIVDSYTGASTKLGPEELKANLVKAGIEPQSSSEDIIYMFDRRGILLSVIEVQ